jgi:acetamidase/formamidase
MLHSLRASPANVRTGVFDASFDPVLTVRSGDTVEIQCLSGRREVMPASGWPHVVPPELTDVMAAYPEFRGAHLLTGPIAIEDAQPGDVLEVRIDKIRAGADWGYTYTRPLMGTLPDEFGNFVLFHTRVDEAGGLCFPPWGGELPFRPFFGVMGVAPPAAFGTIGSKEPRVHGGNIDNRELVEGSRLFLPVHVSGANFSVGDGHGLQGDGEVCVTALEMCLTGTFTFVLRKAGTAQAAGQFPRAETATHFISMGFNESLDQAHKHALREMIDLICRITDLSRTEAYALCSLAADFHVTQSVNGEKGVHGMLARHCLPETDA